MPVMEMEDRRVDEDLPYFLLHNKDGLLVCAVVEVHSQGRVEGSELNLRHRDDCG